MIRAAACSAALVLLAAVPLHAGEPAPETRLFLETETERDSYFQEEPFRITLRIGFDRDFFDSNAVQLFQQRFDVPVEVHAPWLKEWPGTRLRHPPGRGRMQRALTLVLNGEEHEALVTGERERGGRMFTLIEIRRTVLATAPGDLEATAPTARFACATRFREDFVRGRVPLDRRDVAIKGSPRAISIRALPENGQTDGFGGAVGDFTIRAEFAERPQDSSPFRLSLIIHGKGNFELFEAPRLDRLTAFHVYGVLDNKEQAARVHTRTITYDLAVTAGATEIPAIPFTFFHPQELEYKTIHTQPIAKNGRGSVPRTTEVPIEPTPPIDLRVLVGAAILLFALCVFAGVRIGTRRRKVDPGEAAQVFHTQAAATGAELERIFTEYLGVRLGCPAAAVISPDLEQRMKAAGIAPDIAARTARLIESLVAARYGGTETDEAAFRKAGLLVDALEPGTRPDE